MRTNSSTYANCSMRYVGSLLIKILKKKYKNGKKSALIITVNGIIIHITI